MALLLAVKVTWSALPSSAGIHLLL